MPHLHLLNISIYLNLQYPVVVETLVLYLQKKERNENMNTINMNRKFQRLKCVLKVTLKVS